MPSAAWAPVPPTDLARLAPSDFADDELDLPYYLAHFHRLANAVVETGTDRGFIDLSVWRRRQDNRPYNARIQENILSLAFFYTTARPWNPYHQSPVLRTRLEAALDFWCRIQNADGRFSEYRPLDWNLAATAFATKFIGQTLVLLHQSGAPPVDPDLVARVARADRKAIYAVLTDPALQAAGRTYANQYTNVWGGTLAYLSLYPDDKLERWLRQRVAETAQDFQSPAGYFYERGGADWGYNLGTHHSNLLMAWHHTRNTDLGQGFVEEERRFVDWLAYNAVREPDGSGFVLNRGIETRTRKAFLTPLGAFRVQGGFLAEAVPLARAFVAGRGDIERQIERRRTELGETWPQVPVLPLGEFMAYSPYAFLHRDHPAWHPTDAERDAIVQTLPAGRPAPFVHQRTDDREPVVFTYVRRPAYYAAFNAGRHLEPQQRYGLGLVWHPDGGALLQTQTGTNHAAWGTTANGILYEAGDLNATFQFGERLLAPQAGNHDLPPGLFTIRYALGGRGTKTLLFGETKIAVAVRHEGAFEERLPLLVGGDDILTLRPGSVVLDRGGSPFAITFSPSVQAEATETGITVGRCRVVAVRFAARDALDYQLDFPGTDRRLTDTSLER